MSEAYNKDLIKIAEKAAQKCKLNVHKGVYCYCKGPMFENPARNQIFTNCRCRRSRNVNSTRSCMGANHAGMKVLGISCMTNMAAGILDKPLTHIEVMETGKKVEKEFSAFMKEIIKSI